MEIIAFARMNKSTTDKLKNIKKKNQNNLDIKKENSISLSDDSSRRGSIYN